MSSFLEFLQSKHVLAFIFAMLIFLTTLFLVVKRWIGFSITLLLLLFSLVVGLLINYQQAIQDYISPTSSTTLAIEGSKDSFQQQVIKALDDLRNELNTEKENLSKVMNQVQEIFDSMEIQKQKLQNFIEETQEQFKSNYPLRQPSKPPQTDSTKQFN